MAVRTPPVAPTASATPALVPHGSHAGKPSMPMGRPFTLVGSRQRAHLHLLSQSISKCHAIIVNNGGTLYVRDLASREHVIINGKPVREADLKDGDLVRFGSFTFRFVDGVGKGRSAPVRRPPEAALEMSGSSMPLMFDGRVIVIGRRPGCDVVLEEPSVSTIHAAIFELDGRHYIRDLGSRTGTLVNGEPIHHQPLEINDYIRVGDTEIRYIPGNVLGNLDELEHLVGTASLGTETAELASDDAARAAATPAAVEPDPDTIPIAASDSEDAPIPLAIDDDAIPLAEETPVARAALAASAGPAPAVAVPDLAEIDLDSDPDVSGSGDTAAIPLEPVNDTARTPVLSSRVVDSPDDLLDDEPPTPQAIPAAAAPEPDFGLDFLDEQFLPADPAGETIRVETAHAPSDDLGLEPLPVELDESTPQVTTEPPPLAMTAHAASLPAEPEEAIEESAAPTEHAPTDYEALVAAEPTEIAGPSESAVASESIIEDALPEIAEPLESVVASEAIIEDASLEPEVAADETPTDSAGHVAEQPAEAELHFTAPPDVSGEQDPAAVTTADQTPIEDAPASPLLQAATESPDDFDFLTAFAESPTAESPAPVEEPAASIAMEAADVPVHDGPATEQAAPFEEAQSGVDFADEFAAEELAPPTVPPMPVAPPPIPVAPPAIVAEATPSPAKSADTRGKGKTKAKAKKGGISRFFGRRKKGELEAAEEIAPAAQADLASAAPVDASADPDSFRLEELAPGELTPLRKTHEAPEAHGPAPEPEADAPELEATLTAHDAALADIAPLLADEHVQFTDTPAPGPHDTAAIARGVSDKPSPEVVAPTDPTPESALDLDWYINDPVAEPTLDVVGDGATASPADPLSDTSFDQAVQDFSGSALGALVEQAAEQPSAADEVAPAEAASSASVEDTIAQPLLIEDEVAEQQTATDVAATFNPGVLPETPAEDAVGGILDDERFGAGSHLGGPPEPTGDPIMDSAAAFLEHEDQAAEPENEADQILPPVESDAAAHEQTEFSAEPLPATGAQPLPLPTDSAPFAMEPADAAPASEPAPATASEPAPADEHAVGEETVGEFDFAFTAPEEPLPIDFGASTEPATISEAHDEIGFAFPMTDDAASGANEAIAEPPEHAPADEALPVIDEQPAPADAPDRSATPDSPEPAALDEIPPATGEDSQSETLAEVPEPETPSVAAPPKIDPMFGMTRDFGSFLGGLPLSLPPVRKPAPMFGDVPVSPVAEASALQPAARSAEPAIEPSPQTDDVAGPAETAAPAEAPPSVHDIAAEDFGASDTALETTEPSAEFQPQPELDAFAEEPPELFDSAPDKLDTLPDSLEEITDLTQAVGEPAPSADVSAPVEASALSPAAPMFEAPASPAPAAPTTAPASNTRTSLVPAGKTRRALAMTPPPRPKLPRASSVKPGEPVAPEPLAKSPVEQPGVIAMPPVFEVDVFSDMPVGFVAPPIPPIGDFLPQSSPAPRRRKTRVEEPAVTPQKLSQPEQFEETPFGQLPADALPVDEAPAAPRAVLPLRKKPRKFPFFFTIVVMTLTAAAAVGIWYGLPVHSNVTAAIHFEGLDKISEAARHEFFRLRIEQLRKTTRDQAREIYEAPDFRGRKGKGFLYPTGDDAVYQTILSKAYPEGDKLVFERKMTPDGEGDRLRFKALLRAIYVQTKPIGDSAATQRRLLEQKRSELAGKAQEIARLKEQVQIEQAAQAKYTQALDEEKDLTDRSAFLEKIWRDANETARKLRADLEALQAAAPPAPAQAAPDADPKATEMAGKLQQLTEALAAARGGKAGDAGKAAEALNAAIDQLGQEITNARAAQKEGTALAAYLTQAQQAEESLKQAATELAERQTASRQTLATLRRSLAEKIEAHLKTAWGTDTDLVKLEQDLQVKQHRLGAASGGGLSAEADKLREEVAAINKSINARRDQIAAADTATEDVKGVQKIISDEADKFARDQSRSDQRVSEQLKALAAAAPKADALAADQRAVLDRLGQKLAAVSAARQQLAAGIPAAPAAADAGAIDKLEVQVAELQARLDVREKQSATDAAPGVPAPVEDTRAAQLASKRTAVQTAEKAAASALNDWVATKKQLADARAGLEKLKAASNTLLADNRAVYELEKDLKTKSLDIDRQAAMSAGLIPQDPDRRDDSVQVLPASDMRPMAMGSLAIFAAFVTGWRFARSGTETLPPYAGHYGPARRPRRATGPRATSEPIAI